MPENVYSSDDIYVAAALKTAGLKFIGVQTKGLKGVFKFTDSPKREKLIIDYYNGTLNQNVREYVNNWIGFKRLVSELIEREK